MGDAFTCDRCGDVVEGHPDEVVHTDPVSENGHPMRNEREFGDELCEDCTAKLETFMDGRSLIPKFAFENEFIGVATGDSSDEDSDDDTVGYGASAVSFTMTLTPSPYNNEQPDVPAHWHSPHCTAY